MASCKDCIHYDACKDAEGMDESCLTTDTEYEDMTRWCAVFKNKADFVEMVRCEKCKHSRPLNKMKIPEKYYKDSCVVCECEDVVGDEPMIYLGTHFCSYGERK